MTDPRPIDGSSDRPAPLTWRDPVLWLVIAPPVVAVIAGLATLWIAATHRDPLVTDSVQKVGVSWQDTASTATSPAPAPAPTTASDEPKP